MREYRTRVLRGTAIPAVIAGAFHEEPRWFDLTLFDTEGSLGREEPRFIGKVADIAAALRGSTATR